MRTLLLSALLTLTACASSPPPKADPPAPASAAPAAAAAPTKPAVEMAETPYTAAEIRDACPVGRKIVFRIVEKDKPEIVHTIEFLKSDAAGADMRMTDADPSGKVLKTSEGRATWEQLLTHAQFPKDRTVISHRTTVHTLGTLDVLVYKVTEGEGPDAAVTTYHFAKKMPGPPITHFTEKNGVRVLTATMESSALPK
jgi:hypothetical protein